MLPKTPKEDACSPTMTNEGSKEHPTFTLASPPITSSQGREESLEPSHSPNLAVSRSIHKLELLRIEEKRARELHARKLERLEAEREEERHKQEIRERELEKRRQKFRAMQDTTIDKYQALCGEVSKVSQTLDELALQQRLLLQQQKELKSDRNAAQKQIGDISKELAELDDALLAADLRKLAKEKKEAVEKEKAAEVRMDAKKIADDVEKKAAEDEARKYVDLTRFTSMLPVELRCMIYTATIDKPRLLRWRRPLQDLIPDRHNVTSSYSWALRQSRLPASLFLNKEAFKETSRSINLVHAGRLDNGRDLLPWGYINPKKDVLLLYYWSDDPDLSFWPSCEAVPGIEKIGIIMLAKLDHDSIWQHENSQFVRFPDPTSPLKAEEEMVDKLHQFPDLKQMFWVRELRQTWRRSFSSYRFGRKEFYWDFDKLPNIETHECGSFGVVHEEVENRFATLPIPHDERYRYSPWRGPFFKASNHVVSILERNLTEIYNRKYPGTKVPSMTAVYDLWAEGEKWYSCCNEDVRFQNE